MRFRDLETGAELPLTYIAAEYHAMRRIEPENHADTLAGEVLNLMMATISGRNDLEIVGMKPREIGQMIYKLARRI